MIEALTLACIVACGLLVFAEYRGLVRLRIVSKLVASSAFVALALPALHGGRFAQWMFVGLVFGAIGDVALLGRSKRAFLGGLVAFLFGHLAYVVGIAQLEPPARWLSDAGWLAALPVASGLAVLALLWGRLGSLRVPVIAYVAVIAAMVIAALAAYRAGVLPVPQRGWLAAGAVLFFLSDLAVARDRFAGRAFSNKLWGLPTYYAAQILIAWTAISS
jgi:uncharacterized membrane protein YhhN